MRFMSWISATTVVSSLAVLASGCALESGGDDEVGEAQQAQLDPGIRDWILYTIQDPTGAIKGKVLVAHTTGGGYAGNREYWYMSSNLSNSGTYTLTGGTSEYWSNPPSGLGTLSFVTNRTPTWTSATPSGTMMLYSNAYTGERIGIDWDMTVNHGSWFGSITWWHSNTNNVFGPGTSTTLASGTVGPGTWYFYTTQPL